MASRVHELSLPPRLVGNTKGSVEVRIDPLSSASSIQTSPQMKDARIRCVWWGQTVQDAVIFNPFDDFGLRVAVFKVVTRSTRFRDYLRDASRLFFEAIDLSGATIGFSAVDRLERIVDYGGITEELEFINESGQVVALFRCITTYEECDPELQDEPSLRVEDVRPTRIPIKSSGSTATARPPSTVAFVQGSYEPSLPTSKQNPTPRLRTNKEAASKPSKVTFSSLPSNLDSDDYDDVFSIGRNNDMEKSETLRRLVTSSKARSQKSKPLLNSANNGIPAERKRLPSWNLSTERLKLLSRVNQFEISVKKVRLVPSIVPQAQTFQIEQSRNQGPPPPSAKNKKLSSRISFFVNYNLPPSNETVTFCSKKSNGPNSRANDNKRDTDTVVFEANQAHHVQFNPSLLDTWWMSSLQLKLHSRSLNQRMPSHLGEATVGLKHFLMNSKNSAGAEMKLPIYATQSFQRHAGPVFREEIIGDIFVSFKFITAKEVEEAGPPQQSGNCDFQVPTKPLPKEPEASEVVTLSSRSVKSDKATTKMKQVPRSSRLVESSSRGSSSSGSRGGVVLCMIRINEGRNFSSSRDNANGGLYLTSRMFSPREGESVSSSVCWSNNSKPKFEFHHVVPVDLSVDFLEESCCANHMVVEVWSYVEPNSKLVGVVMVSLHQFYTAFHGEDRQRQMLEADLPVIAVNDWLVVRDVLTGREVGEVRVLLAAGLGTQIYRLTMMPDTMTIPAASTSILEFPKKIPSSRDNSKIVSHQCEEENTESDEVSLISDNQQQQSEVEKRSQILSSIENNFKYWQPPQFEVVEDATWSYVAEKICDLENFTEGMKHKLNSTNASAKHHPQVLQDGDGTFDFGKENVADEPNQDQETSEEASLAYLKNRLQSRLTLMAEAALGLAKEGLVARNQDEVEEADEDEKEAGLDDTFTIDSNTDPNENDDDLRPRLAPEGCNPSEKDSKLVQSN